MESNREITEGEELREAIFQSGPCTPGLTPKLSMRVADPKRPRKDSEKPFGVLCG